MIRTYLLALLAFLVLNCSGQVSNSKVVCYYDARANLREGQAKFDSNFLTEPLQFCTHLVYGFAGINKHSYKLESLNPDLDINHNNFREITSLKRRYPGLRVLLSVGGGRDTQDSEKYNTLLESVDNRLAFVTSAANLLKAYDFDGLDLAWQFAPNKPKKIRTFLNSAWSKLKHTFVDPSEIDPKHKEHKDQFVALVRELKNSFQYEGLSLSLAVLPNVNSSLFYDVRSLVANLDHISLWAFDYYTPARNPKEADYPAPLYELIDRKYDENGNYLVQYWLENGTPTNRIVLGIPTFGRSWKMTSGSGISGVPPIAEVDQAGEAGPYTKDAGLLSYQEVCSKLENPSSALRGAFLRKIGDPTGKYGAYAFSPAEGSSKLGTWVGYEDPDSAAYKATYARSKGLAGVAIVDLTLDDFRGLCTGNKYPILRAIKFRL